MGPSPNEPTSDQVQGRAFVIAIILMVLIFFAIRYFQQEMSAFSGAFAYIHIYPFAMLVEYVPSLRNLPLIGPFFFQKVEIAKLFLDQGNFAYMDVGQRRGVLSAAGLCALPVYLPFLFLAGLKGRNFRPDIVYKQAYSLESMIWTQSEHWLTSRVARHSNPLKTKEISAGTLARGVIEATDKRNSKVTSCGELITLVHETVVPPAWGRSMRPEEFLIANGLCFNMDHVRAAQAQNWQYPDRMLESRDKWEDLTLDTLMEALSSQFKKPWRGYGDLRPIHKSLIAVMAMFYDYDIPGGNQLLNDLAGINDAIKSKPGAMDAALVAEDGFMNRIEKILNGRPGKQMLEVANKHAWLESAFPAMLTFARKDRGVLPAAAFLWLKPEDRKIWYILDNVGSEAVMIESAGPMSHFRAENQIGKPIRRPAVYQAARALLEDYLDMTPERVVVRRDKEERGRTAGQKIDLMFKDEK